MFTDQRRASLARMKNLVLTSKPVIDITLIDDQKDAFVPQYTSSDEIKGEVSITTTCDTSFDDIYITFEGLATTFVEKVATTSPTIGRSEAYHNFTRLLQHTDASALPDPRVLVPGKTYKFPFIFVVPDALLPQSCSHFKKAGFPDDGHLTLPPSLGDPLVSSMGKSLMDDMAPDMGTIGTLFSGNVCYGFSVHFRHLWGVETALSSARLLGLVSRSASMSSKGLFLLVRLPSSASRFDSITQWLVSPTSCPYSFKESTFRFEKAMLTPKPSSSVLDQMSVEQWSGCKWAIQDHGRGGKEASNYTSHGRTTTT